VKGRRQSGSTLSSLVQAFFEKHLVVERNVSRNTILAYRDALKLFLAHASQLLGRPPVALDFAVLDAEIVSSFLGSLEMQRGCGPRTRNQRLAAIKAFARYVASVAPEHLERCRRIRELRPARFERPEISYLEDAEVLELVKVVSAAPTRRDRALFLALYNTGARVQEIVDLDVGDVHLHSLPFVRLFGKGRKQRTCPLWTRTAEAIEAWLKERGAPSSTEPLFLNVRGERLGRSGVAHFLRRLAVRAGLAPRHAHRISPHVLRHTTAMHLLQSGVDITTIAAWLGHANLATTHGYVEIDMRMKQAAIAATSVLPDAPPGEFPGDDLVTWLSALGRRSRYAQPGFSAPLSPPAQLPPWRRIIRRSP
jgi:site-specific recombinase XerD